MPIRYDAAPLKGHTRTPTPNGGLRLDANLTRTGVFTYKNPDGSPRREYRPADEVFRADSMSGFRGVPVTIGHPGLVTSRNYGQVAVGHVCDDVRQDGDHLSSSIIVQREDGVRGVERKELSEVSCGYEVDLDPTPGEADGQRYDAIQRNIRPNHVALLPKGRARGGESCSLRLDSNGDEVRYTENDMTPEELAKLLAQAKEDGAGKARMDAKSELDIVTAERDVLKSKVSELTALLNDSARLDSLVTERVELLGVAKDVLGDKYDPKGKTARDIKIAVVAAKNESMRLDDKSSNDYVEAAFRMALSFETAKPHASLGAVRQDAVNAQKPPVNQVLSAAQRNAKASADAWKSPLSTQNKA